MKPNYFQNCEKYMFFLSFCAIIKMMKKNVDSLELYKKLAPIGVFSRDEMTKILSSESKAAYHIGELMKKGYLKRVRHDLYALVSLETQEVIATREQIASKTSPTSYLYSVSALQYLGFGNQVYNEVYFVSQSRLSSFYFEGIRYVPIWKEEESRPINRGGVSLLSLEDSLIDYISSFEKIGGIEELLRSLFLIPSLNEERLLSALVRHDSRKLYQKTGYLLESFRDEFGLSEGFFLECEKHVSDNRYYFSSSRRGNEYFPRWRIYAPKSLERIVNKGEILP